MLYLLDANVLIDANRDYYPIKRVPEFWTWLEHLGKQTQVKVPLEIYEELNVGDDDLAIWIIEHKKQMLLEESVDEQLVANVTKRYAERLNDEEVEKIGRDPFLIAYAVANARQRGIVTTEVSRPSRARANRKLPDVCRDVDVPCFNTFELVRKLGFSTDWKGDSV